MRSLNHSKAYFYRSLAALTEAGVPAATALQHNYGRQLQGAAAAMAGAIARGEGSVSEVMGRHRRLFNQVERQLVQVGERTGTLPMLYGSLARWHELKHRLQAQFMAQMMYPLFLFHAAALLLLLLNILLRQSSITAAGLQALRFLAVPYALVLLFGWLLPRVARNRRGFDSVVYCLPLFGALLQSMALSRFFHIFHLASAAGLTVAEATRLGAGACGNNSLQQRLLKLAANIDHKQQAFSVAYQEQLKRGEQSPIILSMLETAEQSGNIVETSLHIGQYYQKHAETTLRLLANFVPTLLYLLVVGYLACRILLFWSQLAISS